MDPEQMEAYSETLRKARLSLQREELFQDSEPLRRQFEELCDRFQNIADHNICLCLGNTVLLKEVMDMQTTIHNLGRDQLNVENEKLHRLVEEQRKHIHDLEEAYLVEECKKKFESLDIKKKGQSATTVEGDDQPGCSHMNLDGGHQAAAL